MIFSHILSTFANYPVNVPIPDRHNFHGTYLYLIPWYLFQNLFTYSKIELKQLLYTFLRFSFFKLLKERVSEPAQKLTLSI